LLVGAVLVVGILVAGRSVDCRQPHYCNYIAYRIINGEDQYVLTNRIYKAYSL
jgi:hypothetical protein